MTGIFEGRCPCCWQAKIEILNKNTTSDLHLVSQAFSPSSERWIYTVTEEVHLELSGIDRKMLSEVFNEDKIIGQGVIYDLEPDKDV